MTHATPAAGVAAPAAEPRRGLHVRTVRDRERWWVGQPEWGQWRVASAGCDGSSGGSSSGSSCGWQSRYKCTRGSKAPAGAPLARGTRHLAGKYGTV